MSSLAIVVLAAGEGSRFGSAKQLSHFHSKPLLQCVIDHCREVDGIPVYLVLGAYRQRIRTDLDLGLVRVLVNSEWREGMASSIRLATSSLQDDFSGLLFIAGDQPLVEAGDLQKLIDAWLRDPDLLHAANYNDTVGIPAIFPQAIFPELLSLSGDRGAKKILLAHSGRLIRHPMVSAAMDVDRQSDLL